MKGKSPKQGLTSNKDILIKIYNLSIELTEGHHSDLEAHARLTEHI